MFPLADTEIVIGFGEVGLIVYGLVVIAGAAGIGYAAFRFFVSNAYGKPGRRHRFGAGAIGVAVLVVFLAVAQPKDETSNFVSMDEAGFYFQASYGGEWSCKGHRPPTPVTAATYLYPELESGWQERPLGQLPFSFVTCRSVSPPAPGNRYARESRREDRIASGDVLTYGIP